MIVGPSAEAVGPASLPSAGCSGLLGLGDETFECLKVIPLFLFSTFCAKKDADSL